MKRYLFIALCALTASSTFSSVVFAGPPVELLKNVPGPYNTVAVINVESILKTPRAVKEKWATQERTEYLAGTVPLNPSIEHIVAVTEFSPRNRGRDLATAVIQTKRPIDLQRLSKTTGAELTNVADDQILAMPNGNYLAKLSDQLLGVIHTSHRQDIGRWIRANKEQTLPPATRYLNSAVTNSGTRNHFLIAVDLNDMIEEKDVNQAIALSQFSQIDKKLVDSLRQYLVSIRGVRFTINITNTKTELRIAIDGSTLPRFKPELLKDFLIEFLDRVGASLEDIRAGVPAIEGEMFTLTLPITDNELSQLMTMVLPPVNNVTESDVITVTPGEVDRGRTENYLVTINKIIDDLKKKNQRITDFSKTATWHDAAATQIESLSLLNVDRKAAAFGLRTAELLHILGESLRGMPIQVAELQKTDYALANPAPPIVWLPYRGWQANPWHWYNAAMEKNLVELRKQQLDAITKDEDKRNQIWAAIDKERAVVLKELTSGKK